MDAVLNFLGKTGVAQLFNQTNWWQYLIMYVIVGSLFYLAIVKKFEPLLLMPIAFGMLLANLPGAELIHLDFFFDEHYMLFSENGEILGTLASKVEPFVEALKDSFGASAFTIENGVFAISDSFITDGEVDANIMKLFSEHLGDYAKIADNGVIQIKMSTMIKEVINYC